MTGDPVVLELEPLGGPSLLVLELEPLGGSTSPTLALGSVPHEARCGGIDLAYVDAGETTPLAVELIDPGDPDTVIVVAGHGLEDAFARTFSDVFNGEGRCALTLLNDDSILPELTSGRMLRWRYKGRYAMLTTVGPQHRQTLAAVSTDPDSPEEADETSTIQGSEALAALRKALVYPNRWISAGPNPKPKEQTRQINAGTAPFDDSGWAGAILLLRQGDVQPFPIGWGWQPPAFPDPDAYWIAAAGCTITFAPGNAVLYVRRTFLLGDLLHPRPDPTRARLYFGADDFVTVFIDGQQVAEVLDVNSRNTLRYVDFDLTDGEHTLFFIVKNVAAWVPFNPMGLVYSLQELSGDQPVGVLFNSGTTPFTPLRSGPHDKVLFNPPTPPGVTGGGIILALIVEMFARGMQTYWTWDFTVDVDSHGNDWPILPNFVTGDGSDLREVLRTLIVAGAVDLKVDPYRPLIHAYVGGSYPTDSGVDFPVPVEGDDHSLAELTHDTDEPRANVLLVEFANGRIEVIAPDFDPDVDERIEARLDLGRIPDEATARAQALAVLATSARPYRSVAAGWEPADDEHDPYVNPRLIPGCFVDVANGALDGAEQVLFSAVTVAEDEDGEVTVVPELADLAAYEDQLIAAWLERSAPGQMGGLYPLGSSPAPTLDSSVAARTPAFAFPIGPDVGVMRNVGVHVRCHPRELILERWITGSNSPSSSGTSTATLYVNGAAVATVTIPAGQTQAIVSLSGLVDALTPSIDTLGVALTTAAGTFAADHTALVRVEHLQ